MLHVGICAGGAWQPASLPRPTQRCDPSAGSSAGMAGAAPAAPQNQDPPIYNLSSANFGLDNWVHFSRHQQRIVRTANSAVS
jgi:hypothetical protein